MMTLTDRFRKLLHSQGRDLFRLLMSLIVSISEVRQSPMPLQTHRPSPLPIGLPQVHQLLQGAWLHSSMRLRDLVQFGISRV